MAEQVLEHDDSLHPPSGAANWRESLYFGFHDEAGWAAVTYLSLSPNQHAAVRMVVLLMPENAGNLVYLRPAALPDFSGAALETGALRLRCRQPYRRWHLQTEVDCLSVPCASEVSSALATAGSQATPAEHHPVQLEIEFLASMPPYRFPPGALDFLGEGQQHLEQMGRVSGRLRVGGQESAFAGRGSRDHSWGVRDWLRSERYTWVHLQFGADRAMGAVFGSAEGRGTQCGFVYQEDALRPIARMSLEGQHDPTDLHLLGGELHVQTDGGQTQDLHLTSTSFFHVILAREGTHQVHDSLTLVTCTGGGHAGRGFVEHARREQAPARSNGRSLW